MSDHRTSCGDRSGPSPSPSSPLRATPAGALPHPARRSHTWLIRPEAKWLRLPLSCLLIAGGSFGFLPVLGFWMLPIGALLLGEDIPPVRRLTLRGLGRVQRWWDARRPRGRKPRRDVQDGSAKTS